MSDVRGPDRSQQLLSVLRENIVTGTWPINSKIPTETELMAEHRVGRSTVREAVRSLSNLGMLETARSRGTFVRSRYPVSAVLADFVADHTAADLIAVRTALESFAAAEAARRQDPERMSQLAAAHARDVDGAADGIVERGQTPGQFHTIVVEASGNRLLADLYTGLMAGLRRAVATGAVTADMATEVRQHDHAALLDAIRSGDADESARLAAAHSARDFTVAQSPS